MSEVAILCGLGNPEPRYRSNRHNLGFMALDTLSRRHALSWRQGPGPARVARWRVAGRAVTLIEPLTFMNESGAALAKLGGAAADEILVVCDDLNLPLGSLRLRLRGGSGGHKGLDSVIERFGTENFPRLRLGIGAPPAGVDWVEFVLSDFLPEERDAVDRMLETAADAIETAVHRGLDTAMQRFNATGGTADEGAGRGAG
jgi:PTH1 family peptidyl-tRNA hydrolase